MKDDALRAYLESMRLENEADIKAEDDEDDEWRRIDELNQSRLLDKVKPMLPVVVRNYITFKDWVDEDDEYEYEQHIGAKLIVELPECAPIVVNVNVEMDDTGQRILLAELCDGNKAFSVMKYEAKFFDDGFTNKYWKAVLDREILYRSEFDDAVKFALIQKNNKDEVRDDVEKKNNNCVFPIPEPERIQVLMCPLTVMVEDEQGVCVRDQCAWWVDGGKHQGCALVLIAVGVCE